MLADADTGRILVITAHPDDVDFGAAGSVAVWTDAGGSDRSVSRADMRAIRQREQRAAAAVVGVTDVTFLGYPDGRLEPSLDLRRDLTRVIRRATPDRVLCPSPQRNFA